ncbi:hypothetical protein [Inquilinus sp.]|uniref:hypothetical protein n=1 Tax=Inquilinus sp. TaxID=1932117 RepID=UPI0031D6B257
MASNIDPTKPETGLATTASVRLNFQAAKDELETTSPAFSTIAAAVAGAPQAVRDFLLTTGAQAPGDSMAAWKKVVSEPAHAGKFQDSAGSWWELQPPTIGVNVELFGAVGDGDTVAGTGTNNSQAIQNAIEFMTLVPGGGYVYGQADKVYGMGSYMSANVACRMRPNVIVKGAGMGRSTFYALQDNVILFGQHSDPSSAAVTPGYVGFEDLTLWGYADRNTTQGADPTGRLVQVQAFEQLWFRRVEAKYSRHMAISGAAETAWVEDCFVNHNFKDHINIARTTTFIATNNRGLYGGDDFIASHSLPPIGTSSTASAQYQRSVVIMGNRWMYGYGIRVLGAQNAAIVGNHGRFVPGQGLVFGRAGDEGNNDVHSIIMANNTVTDVVNTNVFGGADVCWGIYITPPTLSVGTAPGAPPVAPGQFDYTGKAWVKPNPYWDKIGTTMPKGANAKIILANNIVTQKVSQPGAGTNWADLGFGQFWTNGSGGFQNPAFSTSILSPNSRGIYISGALESVQFSNNQIDGFATGCYFSGTTQYLNNVKFDDNTFVRCGLGVQLRSTSRQRVDVEFTNNTFDIDPKLEHADRAADGSWINASTAGGSAIDATDVTGVVMSGNHFKNAKKPAHITANSGIKLVGNFYYGDPVNLRGMGAYPNPQHNHLIATNENPQDASTDPDAGYMAYTGPKFSTGTYTAQPASGTWLASTWVANASPGAALLSGAVFNAGWWRRTTGSGNTNLTDWLPVYWQIYQPVKTGTASPVGVTAPEFIGQLWVDTAANAIYHGNNPASTSGWIQVATGAGSLGTMATQNANAVNITGGTITGITDLAIADGGTGASTAAAARTNLGLAIGTDVQAFDADLQAIAALTSAADQAPYATGTSTWAMMTVTAAARTVLDDTTTAAMLTTLGAFPKAGGDLTGLVTQSGGNGVVVGGTALVAGVYAGSAVTPQVQVQAAGAVGLAAFRAGASASPPILGAYKTRGASAGAHTAVNTSDQLFAFVGGGSDGTAYRDGFRMIATVTGAPTATNVPTRMDILTGDGTSSFTGLGQDQNGNLQVNQQTVVTQARHIQLRSYTVATLPSAATAAQLIYVSDGTSNKRLAVSDGTNWRWPDGAIVS